MLSYLIKSDSFQILVRRSSPALNIQQAIADFKACTLDPKEEKRLQDEVKRWEDYIANVSRLDEEMQQVQTDVIEVKICIEDVEEKLTGVEKKMKEVETRQDAGLFNFHHYCLIFVIVNNYRFELHNINILLIITLNNKKKHV
jgi:Asp-tRNA(Asn)/Glu-tRNA(Gln) amidotransferase C subunit